MNQKQERSGVCFIDNQVLVVVEMASEKIKALEKQLNSELLLKESRRNG